MQNVTNDGSTIIAASDMNHRTFGDDESWNSLQSTILAGHINEEHEEEKKRRSQQHELSVVKELEEVPSPILVPDDDGDDLPGSACDDSDVLNVNLDAISCADDSVFMQVNEQTENNKSPVFDQVNDRTKNNNNTPDVVKNYLDIGSFGALSNCDSGIENEPTVDILVKLFKNHPTHSTPSYDSGHNFDLHQKSCSPVKCDRFNPLKLSYGQSDEDVSNCSDAQKNSAYFSPHPVAQMKKFFESKCENRRSSLARKDKSPSLKIFRSNALLKKSKIPVLKRPASCSDYSSSSRFTSVLGTTVGTTTKSRSKSASELERSAAGKSVARDSRFVTHRKKTNKSPMDRKQQQQQQQQQQLQPGKRRSTGIVSSPIKSVQITRKLFSPSPLKSKTTVKKRSSVTNFQRAGTGAANKSSTKKSLKVPLITVSVEQDS